ncbi:MAG TPA: DUF1707 domain-containing protein [Acidimicrobiales bacterium]|nr:DUF1707 domain-containing protein [Acidimicrobiales bacterium]
MTIGPAGQDPEPLLVSDDERQAAAGQLNAAYTEGRLSLDEYMARLDEVYASRTDVELAEVFRGLPRPAPPEVPAPRHDLRSRVDWIVGTSTPAALCTAIWALTSGTHGYFWPEWVWLPTGLALLGEYRVSSRRRRRRARRAGAPESLPPAQGAHDQRQILTAVFTDIVESTQQATFVGDSRWREVLHGFERSVDRELMAHHGRKLFTKGDEIVATFRSPARAIQYAVALRDELAGDGLRVRCGIHTGEIEGRHMDLSGVTLHIGQRVSGAAAPGEVLVSATVRDLAFGAGFRFADRGEHELRGLEGTWRLYAVE